MNKAELIREIHSSQEFFDRSTRSLEEKDSAFRPTPEAMSVCQQVAHVAHTIHWLIDGALEPKGFSMDFELHKAAIEEETSLKSARQLLTAAYDRAYATLEEITDAALQEPLPAGPVMGGEPKCCAFGSIVEHTAHHRGALTVYARLCNKVAPMPYMDM